MTNDYETIIENVTIEQAKEWDADSEQFLYCDNEVLECGADGIYWVEKLEARFVELLAR